MRPHWSDENGALCEEHAPDVEGDLDSNETDVPENCQVCGRPCEYTLTDAGVKYVMDHIRETLDAGPEAWNGCTEHAATPSYYRGSRHVEVVRDWADDLRSYALSDDDEWLLKYFLAITALRV